MKKTAFRQPFSMIARGFLRILISSGGMYVREWIRVNISVHAYTIGEGHRRTIGKICEIV